MLHSKTEQKALFYNSEIKVNCFCSIWSGYQVDLHNLSKLLRARSITVTVEGPLEISPECKKYCAPEADIDYVLRPGRAIQNKACSVAA
jgi:hypothetical protein